MNEQPLKPGNYEDIKILRVFGKSKLINNFLNKDSILDNI